MRKNLTKKLFTTLLLFFFAFTYLFGQTISGSTDVCYNTQNTYTATDLPSGASGFSWAVTNGTVVSGGSTNTATIQWNGGTGAASIRFNYNDLVGAHTISKNDITVIGYGGALLTSANPSTICQGDPSALSANMTGSLGTFTYAWSTGETTQNITVSPTSNYSYTITATDQCSNSYIQVIGITVLAKPSVALTSIPANGNICPGSSATLTASGAASYSWSPSTSPATGNTVVAAPSATTTYTVTGTATNGCSASMSYIVTVLPGITVSPAAPNICPAGSVSLSAGAATSCTWSPTTGLSSSSGSTVIASPTATTTYTVTGVLNGCTLSKQVVVNMLTVPVKPTISGPNDLCINAGNQTYGVPIGNTPPPLVTYTWSLSPANFGVLVGDYHGQTATIDFSNTFTGTGTLSLSISNPCGTATTSFPITISSGIPAAPTTSIVGPSSACSASSTYSGFNLGQMTANTVWEVSPANAATSSSYYSTYGQFNVYWTPGFAGIANVRVKIQNGCGSSAWSPSFAVNVVSAVPGTPAGIAGTHVACSSKGAANYSISPATAGTVWEIVPSNAAASSTTSSNGTLTVNWNSSFVGTVNLRAKFQNACGAGAWSNTFPVYVNQTPPISGYSTFCNAGPNYYFGLPDMTSGTVWSVTPSTAVASSFVSPTGSYQVDWNDNFVGTAVVKVIFPSGCGTGPWSSSKTVTVTSGTCPGMRLGTIDDIDTPLEILAASIYPNPFDNSANLLITGTTAENSTVEIFDAKGIKVYSNDQVSAGSELTIGQDLQPGIYSVMILSNNEVKVSKFIKLN